MFFLAIQSHDLACGTTRAEFMIARINEQEFSILRKMREALAGPRSRSRTRERGDLQCSFAGWPCRLPGRNCRFAGWDCREACRDCHEARPVCRDVG